MMNFQWQPIAWAYMQRKTIRAYRAVFSQMRRIYGGILQPEFITIDFEKALASAIRREFPNATLIRCYFHHMQVTELNFILNGHTDFVQYYFFFMFNTFLYVPPYFKYILHNAVLLFFLLFKIFLFSFLFFISSIFNFVFPWFSTSGMN